MKLVHSTRLLVVALMAVCISLTSVCLTSTPALAACAPLPADKGQATFAISLPSAANYRVWSRVYSPSASSNGYYMQVDQTYCAIVIGDSASIPVGTFTWVNYRDAQPANPITLNMTAGAHSVIIAGLDAGVGIDRVMFLSDLTCIPSGTGDNCNATTSSSAATPTTTAPTPTTPSGTTASPTSVVVGTAGPSQPVSGILVLSNPSDGSSAKVIYSVDGKPVTGDSIDTTKLSNGVHTVTATTTNPDGTTSLKTTTITTNNDLNFWQWVASIFSAQWWWIRIVLTALVFGAMVGMVLFRRFHSKLHFARHKAPHSAAAVKTYLETINSQQEHSKS